MNPPATIATVSEQPGIEASTSSRRVIAGFSFALTDAAQRLGAIAFFTTLALWSFLFLRKDPSYLIAVAAGASNLGCCSALLAWSLAQPKSIPRREATGAAVFNLVFLVLTVHLMLYTRLDVIRISVDSLLAKPPQSIGKPVNSPP
jgi:hypothetical protein